MLHRSILIPALVDAHPVHNRAPVHLVPPLRDEHAVPPVLRVLRVQRLRVLAQDVLVDDRPADGEVVAAPRVIRACTVRSERPGKVGGSEDGDVVPLALGHHLG